jgi:hypothetical protein
VYTRVTEPFRYVDGFHELTKYLRRRFQRRELLRISQAMAKYRPSFIALTKTLKEEDLVFMEKCFQRTLMVVLFERKTNNRSMKSLFRIVGHPQLFGDELDRSLLSERNFVSLPNGQEINFLKNGLLSPRYFITGLLTNVVNGRSIGCGVFRKVCDTCLWRYKFRDDDLCFSGSRSKDPSL